MRSAPAFLVLLAVALLAGLAASSSSDTCCLAPQFTQAVRQTSLFMGHTTNATSLSSGYYALDVSGQRSATDLKVTVLTLHTTISYRQVNLFADRVGYAIYPDAQKCVKFAIVDPVQKPCFGGDTGFPLVSTETLGDALTVNSYTVAQQTTNYTYAATVTLNPVNCVMVDSLAHITTDDFDVYSNTVLTDFEVGLKAADFSVPSYCPAAFTAPPRAVSHHFDALPVAL